MPRRALKLALVLIVVLATALYSAATCSVVQTGTSGACAGTTCALTGGVGSTGTGHLIELFASSGGGSDFTITASATGAGTAILCAAGACHVTGNLKTVDQAYILSSSVSPTVTVTLNTTPAGGWSSGFKEYTCTGALTFDLGATLVNAACTTSCLGVSITPTGTDLIFQTCNGSPNCLSVSAPYSGDVTIFSGDGIAASGGIVATSQPTWTLSTTGAMVFSGMAFKEAQAGGATPAPCFCSGSRIGSLYRHSKQQLPM